MARLRRDGQLLDPRFVPLAPPGRGENSPKPIARSDPRTQRSPRLLLPLRHEVGERAGGEVVRLIFKGVPISKQYLKNLPITLHRTPPSLQLGSVSPDLVMDSA